MCLLSQPFVIDPNLLVKYELLLMDVSWDIIELLLSYMLVMLNDMWVVFKSRINNKHQTFYSKSITSSHDQVGVLIPLGKTLNPKFLLMTVALIELRPWLLTGLIGWIIFLVENLGVSWTNTAFGAVLDKKTCFSFPQSLPLISCPVH